MLTLSNTLIGHIPPQVSVVTSIDWFNEVWEKSFKLVRDRSVIRRRWLHQDCISAVSLLVLVLLLITANITDNTTSTTYYDYYYYCCYYYCYYYFYYYYYYYYYYCPYY